MLSINSSWKINIYSVLVIIIIFSTGFCIIGSNLKLYDENIELDQINKSSLLLAQEFQYVMTPPTNSNIIYWILNEPMQSNDEKYGKFSIYVNQLHTIIIETKGGPDSLTLLISYDLPFGSGSAISFSDSTHESFFLCSFTPRHKNYSLYLSSSSNGSWLFSLNLTIIHGYPIQQEIQYVTITRIVNRTYAIYEESPLGSNLTLGFIYLGTTTLFAVLALICYDMKLKRRT